MLNSKPASQASRFAFILWILALVCLRERTVFGQIDFAKDIVPVLTRAGCNSGACHGAAAGRGYLSLSLYGSRPAADYETLVHTLAGRYLDLQQPQMSLLLQKPSGYLEHGGGVPLDESEGSYDLVRRWIAELAPPGSLATVKSLSIGPSQVLDIPIGQSAEINVIAQWDDGDRRPAMDNLVIDGARRADDSGSAPVEYTLLSNGSVQLTPTRPGYHLLTLRLGPVACGLQIWSGEADLQESNILTANDSPVPISIDSLVDHNLRRVGLSSASAAPPHVMARRLWIDLAGRHPSIEEWRTTQVEIGSGDVASVVDRLLGSKEFLTRAGSEIASWAIPVGASGGNRDEFAQAVSEFLEGDDSLQHLAVAALSVPSEDSPTIANRKLTSSPLNIFHRFASEPRSRAELIASVWMGVRVGCAQCHDHPLDHWTQDDYFAMAACWAEIESTGEVRRIAQRSTTDLRTGQPAVARLPDADAPYSHPSVPADQAFIQWLCHTEEHTFSRNLANRVWKWLFGIGLVEEVDDHRATNPPINDELLDYLATYLQDHDYSLKSLVRLIVLSGAYARQSDETTNRLAHQLIAVRSSKPIVSTVERLALVALRGDMSSQTNLDSRNPVSMMDSPVDNGCLRKEACADPLSESLELAAGQSLNTIIHTAVADRAKQTKQDAIFNSLGFWYESIFGVPAASAERAHWDALFATESSSQSDTHERVEDLLWSWLVSENFRRLH